MSHQFLGAHLQFYYRIFDRNASSARVQSSRRTCPFPASRVFNLSDARVQSERRACSFLRDVFTSGPNTPDRTRQRNRTEPTVLTAKYDTLTGGADTYLMGLVIRRLRRTEGSALRLPRFFAFVFQEDGALRRGQVTKKRRRSAVLPPSPLRRSSCTAALLYPVYE